MRPKPDYPIMAKHSIYWDECRNPSDSTFQEDSEVTSHNISTNQLRVKSELNPSDSVIRILSE